MKEIEKQIKELRFLQPNNIDQETLNNPEKLKAYFDWKYENFEDEYKVYCKAKKDVLNVFLNTLSPEKKDYYVNRYHEYLDKSYAIHTRYADIIDNSIAIGNCELISKVIDEERAEREQLEEEYKDIKFMHS